jgi:hypothetical protein
MARELGIYGTRADAGQGDPVAAERVTALQYQRAEEQEPGGEGGDALEQNLGNTVTVPLPPLGSDGFTLQNWQALVFATFRKSQHATLMVQADGLGTFLSITTRVAGRAQFTRQFPLPVTTVPRFLQLFGKMIDIEVAGVTNAAPVHVTAALITEQIDAFDQLWPTWVPATQATGGVVAKKSRLVPTNMAAGSTQGGYLLGAQGFLTPGTGTVNASYFLMFFDALNGPANGTQPLVAIGPLVGGQPSPFAFDRSQRPDVTFQQGLWYALSSTPDVYTDIADSATVRVDFDWGT